MMQAIYINPFLRAISRVLKDLIPDIEIERGQLDKKESPIITSGCASIVSITGTAVGRVILDMTESVSLSIAGAFHQEVFPHFNELVASTINEITNMICGGAITELNGQGLDMEISPPSLFLGEKMELYDAANVSTGIVIPIKTNYGDILVNVALS
jgi:chemotaxis protein CheX